MADNINQIKEINKLLKEAELTQERRKVLEQDRSNLIRQLNQLVKEEKITLEESRQIREDSLKLDAELEISRKKQAEDQRQINELQENYSNQIRVSSDEMLGLFGISDKWQSSFIFKGTKILKFLSESDKGFKNLISSGELLTNTIGSLGAMMTEAVGLATFLLIGQQEQAIIGFRKMTAGADEFAQQILSTEKELFRYGVTLQEATEAQVALFSGFTDYSTMAPDVRKELLDTTAALGELGISFQTTVENAQFLRKGLGMTAEDINDVNKEIYLLAKDIALPPQMVAENFNKAIPVLSRFGKEAKQVFQKLQINAKKAGIEVAELLDITDRFDTFDNAADSVGRLNAILGGAYLSTLDMVTTTDPTERMKMLSGAVRSAGLAFEDLSYYEKLNLAETLGFGKDTYKLAKLMNDEFNEMNSNFSNQEKSLENLQEDMNKFHNITEDLTQLFRSFAVDFGPTFIKILETIKWAIDGVTSFTQGLNEATNGYANVAIFVTGIGLTLAASLMAIGVGGGVASASMTALSGGIATVGAAATGPQGAGLLALGGTIALIGAGTYMAASGFANMLTAIGGLQSVLNPTFVGSLTGLVMSFTLFGATGLVGITAFSTGLVGLGMALQTVQLAKIEALQATFEALASTSSETTNQVVENIRKIVAELNSIPQQNMINISKIFEGSTSNSNMKAISNLKQPLVIKLNNREMAKYIIEVVNNEIQLTEGR